MVQAGLTPWEAISIGTYNPAVFFGTLDEVGTVAEGKRADLMVAKRNPLKKIGRLQDLAGVMVNGVWLSEDDLANRLENLATRWAEQVKGTSKQSTLNLSASAICEQRRVRINPQPSPPTASARSGSSATP